MRSLCLNEVSLVSGGDGEKARFAYQLPACSGGSMVNSTITGAIGGAAAGLLGAGVGAVAGAIIGAVVGLGGQSAACAASQVAENVKPGSGW